MDYELKNKLVKIISKNILTPVIYMIENDNLLDFICFCDRNIKMQEIYNVEQQIKEVTNKNVEIIDIREFGESERIEVINQATLIYSEHKSSDFNLFRTSADRKNICSINDGRF